MTYYENFEEFIMSASRPLPNGSNLLIVCNTKNKTLISNDYSNFKVNTEYLNDNEEQEIMDLAYKLNLPLHVYFQFYLNVPIFFFVLPIVFLKNSQKIHICLNSRCCINKKYIQRLYQINPLYNLQSLQNKKYQILFLQVLLLPLLYYYFLFYL